MNVPLPLPSGGHGDNGSCANHVNFPRPRLPDKPGLGAEIHFEPIRRKTAATLS